MTTTRQIFALATLITFAVGTAQAQVKNVDPSSTWTLDASTTLEQLIIGKDAAIKAPEGRGLTFTLNGVQQDLKPGTYKGKVVLTLTDANTVPFAMGNLKANYNFRQALFVDKSGVVDSKSVRSAVQGGTVTNTGAKNIKIISQGENFNGVFVTDGAQYTLENIKVDFTGNGENDFAGYGAAIMSTGKGTKLVLDQADIKSRGVVRTTVIAADGSNLVVKNSKIQGFDGVLPAGYRASGPPKMWVVPWMLGLLGNMRATSVLGEGPTATYINSDVSAEGWGALSTDSVRNAKLVTINSKVWINGISGYGAYNDGNGTVDSFYGTTFDVVDYAVIATGGTINFGDSNAARVAELNSSLNLGLTEKEKNSLKAKPTVVNSDRFGVMCWNSKCTTNVEDNTVFNTKKAAFIVRGSPAEFNVDGAKGAKLNVANGMILQVIDKDKADSRRDAATGNSYYDGMYTEPYDAYTDIVKDATHDVTAVTNDDIIGNYRNIELKGNFYNGTTGIKGNAAYPSKNMALNFSNAKVTGAISATFAKHAKNSFGAEDRLLVSEVTNTPKPAVNNGTIVSLDGKSSWTVTGTSYLTKLVLAPGASIAAPKGKSVVMTVNGVETRIMSGTYVGAIALDLK